MAAPATAEAIGAGRVAGPPVLLGQPPPPTLLYSAVCYSQELLRDPEARDLSAATLLLVMSCLTASVRQACLALPAGVDTLEELDPAFEFAENFEWETQLDVRAMQLLLQPARLVACILKHGCRGAGSS